MEQTTLDERPELFVEVVSLIEKSFKYNKDNAYEVDFYPLMKKENHHNNHILIKDNKVVAHIGYLERKILVKDKEFSAYFIGGIAVDEKHRGKGLFKELLNNTLEIYQDMTTFFLMWSDKADLYENFSFYQCGSVFQLGEEVFNEENNLSFKKEDSTSLSTTEIKDLTELYNSSYKNIISPKRDSQTFRELLNVISSDLYIKRDDQGNIEHYLFMNKGFDLDGVIHEYSFLNNSKLMSDFKRFKLWSPTNTYGSNTTFFLGLFKVGAHSLFKEMISTIFDQELSIIKIDKNIDLEFRGENFSVSQSDFIEMVFGPGKADEFEDFQTSIFISGLESI